MKNKVNWKAVAKEASKKILIESVEIALLEKVLTSTMSSKAMAIAKNELRIKAQSLELLAKNIEKGVTE